MKIEDLNFPRKERNFINFGGCTNHFADVNKNSNGRNYSINIELEDHKVGFKKETIHRVYDTQRGQKKKLNSHFTHFIST